VEYTPEDVCDTDCEDVEAHFPDCLLGRSSCKADADGLFVGGIYGNNSKVHIGRHSMLFNAIMVPLLQGRFVQVDTTSYALRPVFSRRTYETQHYHGRERYLEVEGMAVILIVLGRLGSFDRLCSIDAHAW